MRRTYFVSWLDPRTTAIGNNVVTTYLRGEALVRHLVECVAKSSKDAVILNIVDIT